MQEIDFKKFVKYSKPGPRYTSYPTAPEFSQNFSYDEYIELLKNINTQDNPLSIYVHLPFCRSACYFCGCNVIYTSKDEKKQRYISYLKKELSILKNILDTSKEVVQFHFGGGTPTFFSASELDIIMQEFKSVFSNFAHNAEISCEIDPRYLNKEQMSVLTKHGFNRISFGVQDFDEKVQQAVHRIQSFELTKQAVALARDFGIKSINTDLIYGLPFQDLQSFKKTLELTLKLNPDRLAVFNYAHVPWLMKTMRKIDETTLPTPDVKLQILEYTINFLTSNGYKMIGMDHFAKPDDELFTAIEKNELYRNFQGYTTKGGTNLLGIGVTSIGYTKEYYAQNYKDLKEYEKAIDSNKLPYFKGIRLNEDDKIRKDVIMRLMSNFKLDFSEFEKKYNIDFREYFKDSLQKLKSYEEENLLELSYHHLKVTPTGAMIIRNIAMAFDAYLDKLPENKRRFSKTV